MTPLVRRRKPFFYFMPGYPRVSRAFAIRKLLIAAACDTLHECHKPVRTAAKKWMLVRADRILAFMKF